MDVVAAERQLKRWLIIGFDIPTAPGSRRTHMFENKARFVPELTAEQKARAIATGQFASGDLEGL